MLFSIWGGEAVHLAAFIRQRSHVRIVPPERLRRLKIGLLPVEENGASLSLVAAASFPVSPVYASLVWRMLFQGIDSRVRFPSPAPFVRLVSHADDRP